MLRVECVGGGEKKEKGGAVGGVEVAGAAGGAMLIEGGGLYRCGGGRVVVGRGGVDVLVCDWVVRCGAVGGAGRRGRLFGGGRQVGSVQVWVAGVVEWAEGERFGVRHGGRVWECDLRGVGNVRVWEGAVVSVRGGCVYGGGVFGVVQVRGGGLEVYGGGVLRYEYEGGGDESGVAITLNCPEEGLLGGGYRLGNGRYAGERVADVPAWYLRWRLRVVRDDEERANVRAWLDEGVCGVETPLNRSESEQGNEIKSEVEGNGDNDDDGSGDGGDEEVWWGSWEGGSGGIPSGGRWE